MSDKGTPVSLEEAHTKMGGEYLMNAEAPVLEIRHDQLERWSDHSVYKSDCPACSEGILLVRRHEKTFDLLENDCCIVCAQQVRYLDIDELMPTRPTGDE